MSMNDHFLQTVLDLPIEVWGLIIAYSQSNALNFDTHKVLSLTCKGLGAMTNNEIIWRIRLKEMCQLLCGPRHLPIQFDDYVASIKWYRSLRGDSDGKTAVGEQNDVRPVSWAYFFKHFYLLAKNTCIVCLMKQKATNGPFTNLPPVQPLQLRQATGKNDERAAAEDDGHDNNTFANVAKFPFAHSPICMVCLREQFIKMDTCVQFVADRTPSRAAAERLIRGTFVEYKLRRMNLFVKNAVVQGLKKKTKTTTSDNSSGGGTDRLELKRKKTDGPSLETVPNTAAPRSGGAMFLAAVQKAEAAQQQRMSGGNWITNAQDGEDPSTTTATREEPDQRQQPLPANSANVPTRRIMISMAMSSVYSRHPDLSGRPEEYLDPLGFCWWAGHAYPTPPPNI